MLRINDGRVRNSGGAPSARQTPLSSSAVLKGRRIIYGALVQPRTATGPLQTVGSYAKKGCYEPFLAVRQDDQMWRSRPLAAVHD